MNKFLWQSGAYRMADAEGGAAPVVDAPVVAPVDPSSILFPADAPKPEGDTPAVVDKVEWKEYEADPTKSEADNATAKAEHDKAKPVEAVDTVPEDGKYTLTMPEGVEVDTELLDAVSPEFKSLGLTTKQAQALTDKFVAIQTERAKKQGEGWSKTVEGWIGEAKADPDMGGAKWDATVKVAVKAVDTLGTPALKDYLTASGGGNHPELIRFMAKVGAMIREDNPASGGAGGSGKPIEAAHVLFPNDAPKGT